MDMAKTVKSDDWHLGHAGMENRPWTLEPGRPGFCLLCCWLSQSAMLLLSPISRVFYSRKLGQAEAPPVDQASSCLSSDPHATPRSWAFMIVPFCRGGNRLRGVRELAWSPRAGNGWTGLQSLVCLNLFFVIPAHLPRSNTDLLWLSAWQSD